MPGQQILRQRLCGLRNDLYRTFDRAAVKIAALVLFEGQP